MDIKLKDFEGPLDLLLHLVSKYEVDIYDIPLVEVIEQYLAYLATLKAMRLEVAGEYMVMASQLMLIKSRKLLPTVVAETPPEEDLEFELLSQIEEYKRFKAVGRLLQEQHHHRAQLFSKVKTEMISDDIILKQDKTTMDIYLAFSMIMTRKQTLFNQQHTTVRADEYRIEDMMDFVQEKLNVSSSLVLTDLFIQVDSKEQMVTIFLAILELIKRQVIRVQQRRHFSDIVLMKERL